MRGTRGLAALLLSACVDNVELASAPSQRDAAAPTDLSPPRDGAVDSADAPRPDAPSSLTVQAVFTVSAEGTATSRKWHTEIEVSVSRAGAAVTSAQVSLTSPLSTEVLSLMSGRYRASQEAYAPWYELTVTTPDERVASQRWAWLAPHVFSTPRADESHDPLTPLAVAWAPTGADEAQLTSPTTLPAMADTGAVTVPGANFPRGEGSVTVLLRRRATVAITNFAAGSTARFEVTAAVRVMVP